MKLRRIVCFIAALTLSASMSMSNVLAEATSSNAESAAQTEESGETPEEEIYDTENGESVEAVPEEVEPQSETTTGTQTGESTEKIDDVLMLGQAGTLDVSPKVTVELPKAGDKKTIDMQIDHSLYPEAILCAFISGGSGDCTVNVSGVKVYTLKTKASGGSTGYSTKEVFKINGSGGVKNYTVTVSTTTGNIDCALILATEDTFAETCGGRENAASVQKNEATTNGATFTAGMQSLLNGDGEWFRYKADGDTFIHASATRVKDFVVTVYDADTGLVFDKTESKDLVTQTHSSTLWTGHIQRNFKLKSGHDYLIRIQSTTRLASNSDNRYNFSVGLPYTVSRTLNLSSTKTYSLPANTTKTFRFSVDGYPNSTRLAKSATISFRPSSAADNVQITSLRITAPNGKVLTAANYGEYYHTQNVNFSNYLTSLDNISLNGTWTVTVKAKSSISGLKFKINGNAYYIPGSDGNE